MSSASRPDRPEGTGGSGGSDPAPVTDRLPSQAPAQTSPSAGADAGNNAGTDERERSIAVLDEPLDDKDLEAQIRRPGLSRSTRRLLLLLVAVVVFGLGTLLGRATAPDTGPGSAPAVVGDVESISPGTGPGTAQLTLRTEDGEAVVVGTTAGTRLVVSRPDGLAGLQPGQRVLVDVQVNQLGSLDATHVDLAPPP